MRNHKMAQESLTSSESTELKQVDVAGVGPKSHEIREQSREDDTRDMIESITSVSPFKGALFGYKKSDVADQFSLAREKMYDFATLIDAQRSEIKSLKEITESNVQTVLDQNSLSEDTSELEQMTERALRAEELAQKLSDQLRDAKQLNTTPNESDVDRVAELEIQLQAKDIEADNAARIASEQLSDTQSKLDAALSDLEAARTVNRDLDSVIEGLKKQIEDLQYKNETLERTANSDGEAYMQIGRVLADANKRADEIIAKANTRALEIKNEADEDRQRRIEQANKDVAGILEQATETVNEMFESSQEAREQIVTSHNTLMRAARENQNKLLDMMSEQKELFKQQVVLATDSKLDEIFSKSQVRLDSAKGLLDSRQVKYSNDLEAIKSRTLH